MSTFVVRDCPKSSGDGAGNTPYIHPTKTKTAIKTHQKMSAFIRKIGLSGLFWLALLPVFADCLPGSTIALVKKNERDWPTSYRDLNRRLSVPLLNHYFFVGNASRECITLAELQLLSADANRVLGTSRDPKAKAFVAAIQRVADYNKPTTGAATPGANTASGSVQTVKSRMPNGTNTLDPQTELPVGSVIEAAKEAETELPAGRSPISLLIGVLALGALGGTLLGGALVYLRFYQAAKREAADLRAENQALNRQIDESRRKSPSIAPVGPNKEQLPDPRTPQKGWADDLAGPHYSLTDAKPRIVVETTPDENSLTDTMPSVIPISPPPTNRSDGFRSPPPNPDTRSQ